MWPSYNSKEAQPKVGDLLYIKLNNHGERVYKFYTVVEQTTDISYVREVDTQYSMDTKWGMRVTPTRNPISDRIPVRFLTNSDNWVIRHRGVLYPVFPGSYDEIYLGNKIF